MTIKHDPNVPVYFFYPLERKIHVGRFLRVSALTNIIVAVDSGDPRTIEHYYSSRAGIKFTNDFKEAQKDALEYFHSELQDKKQEITQIYKDIFAVKKALRRPLFSVIQQLLKGK